MSKSVLGKGIGALFTEITEPQNTESLAKVSLDLLKPNPYQPRREFNEDSLFELSESIRQNGILQPILAEQEDDGTYIIIAGERRVRAAKIAGLKEIPAILNKFTKEEKLEIALIENIQREDLTPLEEAYGYKNIAEILNCNQDEVAKKVGKKRSTIANALRLIKLPESMKNGLNNGIISAGHARTILSLINPADQELLYTKIVENNLSVREAERLASQYNKGQKLRDQNKKTTNQKKTKDQVLESVIQKLINFFGTKVEIKGNQNNGKIEISYYSMTDLERILEIIEK